MTAIEYAAKRAAGLCTWGSCRRHSVPTGILCKSHLRRRRTNVNRLYKERYLAKKMAGVCVHPHCKEPSREDCILCQKHTETHRRESKRYRATESGRATKRKIQLRYRNGRVRRGLCILCDSPLVTKTLCQKHREAAMERWRVKHGKGPVSEQCSNCDELGHRSRSCTAPPRNAEDYDVVLAPLPPLRIDDFASAREAA